MKPEAKKSKAMEIIKEMTEDGPCLAAKIKEACVNEGISEHTCTNAKRELGVRAVKAKKTGRWMWYRKGWKARCKKKETKKKKETVNLQKAVANRVDKNGVVKPPKKKTSKDKKRQEEAVRCLREMDNLNLFAPQPED